MKFKPPCWVTIEGHPNKKLALRRISVANHEMKKNGWKGLVAHVQNTNGIGLVEYRKLRPYSDPK